MKQTIIALKNKEIMQKIPLFSLVSTMEVMNKAIDMKAYKSDPRTDDIYMDAADGEEYQPPQCDNIGRSRKLNDPSVVSYFASQRVDLALSEYGGKASALGQHLLTGGRTSNMSARSSRSRVSKAVSHQGTDDGRSKKSATLVRARKPSKRSDSAKKQNLEKRLLAYY